jgi:hypothetical protein
MIYSHTWSCTIEKGKKMFATFKPLNDFKHAINNSFWFRDHIASQIKKNHYSVNGGYNLVLK